MKKRILLISVITVIFVGIILGTTTYFLSKNEGAPFGIVEASDIKFRDDYVIQWKDTAFENLIRQYLGKESGDIHYDDVKLIEDIEIWGQVIARQGDHFDGTSLNKDNFVVHFYDAREGNTIAQIEGKNDGKIKSMADLEHFTSLKTLSLNYQECLDITALANVDSIDCLHRLEDLTLISDSLVDISVVSNLIALKSLRLDYNNILDILPISKLIDLNYVSFYDSEQLSFSDVLGLRELNNVIIFSSVNTVDLSVFNGMSELTKMVLVGNENIDYSLLTKLNLDYLMISCEDSKFQIVNQLTTLTTLRLYGEGYWTQTGGLTNISGIENLSNLKYLELRAPNCHDISALASLVNLEELILKLPDDCDITALTKIESLKKVGVYTDSASNGDSRLVDRVITLLPTNVQVSPYYY